MKTVTSFTFNLSGMVAYQDNTSEPFQVSFDSQTTSKLTGTDDVFSQLVGSNFADIVDFQDHLLPAVWNFVPINTGKSILDATIHLYGTVAYNDGTSDIFDIERNRGESNNYVPNNALADVTEQSDTNEVITDVISQINDGVVVIDNGVGRNWELVLNIPYTTGDNPDVSVKYVGGIYFCIYILWDVDYNLISSTIYRSVDGVNWTEVFTDPTVSIYNIVDFGGYFLMLDTTIGNVYKSYDNGITWNNIVPAFDGYPKGAIVNQDGVGLIGGEKIYRTENGIDWTAVVSGLTPWWQGAPGFAWTPYRPNEFLYFNDFGVWLSEDTGLTWRKTSSLAFNRDYVVYQGATLLTFASDGKKVYQSLDFGRTWTEILNIVDGFFWVLGIDSTMSLIKTYLTPGLYPNVFYLQTTDKLSQMGSIPSSYSLIDGKNLYIQPDYNNDLYRSTDFGFTMTKCNGVFGSFWAVNHGVAVTIDSSFIRFFHAQ